MTAVSELVEQVRVSLHGGSADALSVLDQPYTPGQTAIKLRYPFPQIMAGQTLSAGLATFYVLKVGTGGLTIDVLPGVEDGIDRAANAGDIVRLNPKYTTGSIFREWNLGLERMSAPKNGLYGYGSFLAPSDPVSGMYFLPASWADKRPQELLVARYHRVGTTSWQNLGGAQFQLDQNAVRVYGAQPIGTTVEFVFAFPYTKATALTDTVEALGLNEHTMDIPGLFACSRLGRGKEQRRVRVEDEGSSRNAALVPPGANLGVARDWLGDAMQRVMEESGRLVQQFGYQVTPVIDSTVPLAGGFV